MSLLAPRLASSLTILTDTETFGGKFRTCYVTSFRTCAPLYGHGVRVVVGISLYDFIQPRYWRILFTFALALQLIRCAHLDVHTAYLTSWRAISVMSIAAEAQKYG